MLVANTLIGRKARTSAGSEGAIVAVYAQYNKLGVIFVDEETGDMFSRDWGHWKLVPEKPGLVSKEYHVQPDKVKTVPKSALASPTWDSL